MSNKFKPVNLHILIKPEQITNTIKQVKTDDGRTVDLQIGDRSRELMIKAVNKGEVVESGSADYKIGQVLVYYPFSPNKINLDDKEFHVIHEKDVMGIVES